MSTETTQPAPSKSYTGSCHCGSQNFTTKISPPLDAEGATVTECNCTICARKAYLLAFSAAAETTWAAGGLDKMSSYRFGKERFEHYFCSVCGTAVAVASIDPDMFPGMVAWNVRLLEGVDVEKLKVKPVDGKSY